MRVSDKIDWVDCIDWADWLKLGLMYTKDDSVFLDYLLWEVLK